MWLSATQFSNKVKFQLSTIKAAFYRISGRNTWSFTLKRDKYCRLRCVAVYFRRLAAVF